MSNKVLLVVIDGLKYQTALDHCGFLEGMVEAGKARRWKMQACIPSMSLPCYESLHTGLDPVDHGITTNSPRRESTSENTFSVARSAGKTTGAVAYSWFSALYNGSPYIASAHMETDDETKIIQTGRFYDDSNQTDFHLAIPSDNDLCAQVDRIIGRCGPDYLLFHTMTVDSVGHVYGGASWQYDRAATIVDTSLARHVPGWRKAGYRVLVTADHGFTDSGYHGGTEASVRDVAFYDIGHPKPGATDEPVSQRAVAPTVLSLLGVDAASTMVESPLT